MVVISMLCNTYTEVLLLIQKNSHNMLTPSIRANCLTKIKGNVIHCVFIEKFIGKLGETYHIWEIV